MDIFIWAFGVIGLVFTGIAIGWCLLLAAEKIGWLK